MNASAAAEVDAASDVATLTALQQACNDTTLPAPTRQLLQDAHDAPAVAIAARSAEQNHYRALFDAALELEFTERVLIEDDPETLKTFAELRAMGVVLTIDDFGEGYSALNYLRRLPIHGLKLSQLFVQGVPGNKSDVAICQAVAGIARSLGLGLVAKGVESEAQRAFLLKLGVSVGQGFLFAPSLPADEFAQHLRRVRIPAATK